MIIRKKKPRELQITSNSRVETGPTQIRYQNGEPDWKGLFIRGDDCMGLLMHIRHLEYWVKLQPKGSMDGVIRHDFDKLLELGRIIEKQVLS
jgi:hypothetical protein